MLIDAHAHFYPPEFSAPEIDLQITQAKEAGVVGVVCVAEDMSSINSMDEVGLANPVYDKFIYPGYGLHPATPKLSLDLLNPVLEAIRKNSDRLVCVGEIGLDYSRRVLVDEAHQEAAAMKQTQLDVLNTQLDLALELDLPVNVHSYCAGHYVVKALKERGVRKALLHAFDGKASYVREALLSGYYFSLAPCIVQSQSQQRLAELVPLDRILLETDAPALAAERGAKNTLKALRLTLEKLSFIKQLGEEEVETTVWNNTMAIFAKSQMEEELPDDYFLPSTPYQGERQMYSNRGRLTLGGSSHTSDSQQGISTQKEQEDKLLEFVDDRLTRNGLASPFRLLQGSREGMVQTASSILELLRQQQKDVEHRQEMEEKYRRLLMENEALMASMNKLKNKLELAERETDQYKARLSNTEQNLQDQTEKHRNTKEELKVLKISFQQCKSQYIHELRKKELEHSKLKERMQKVMTDRYKASKIGVRVLNAKETFKSSGEKISFERYDDPIYKGLLSQAQIKESSLITENMMLRRLLSDVKKEVEKLLLQQGIELDHDTEDRMQEEGQDAAETEEVLRPGDAKVYLPLKFAGKEIEANMEKVIGELAEQWEHFMHLMESSIDKETFTSTQQTLAFKENQLQLQQKQIDELKYVVEEQAKLLSTTTSADFVNGVSPSPLLSRQSNGGDELTSSRLAKEWEEEKMAFMQERKKFAEAAIKIGKERTLLNVSFCFS